MPNRRIGDTAHGAQCPRAPADRTWMRLFRTGAVGIVSLSALLALAAGCAATGPKPGAWLQQTGTSVSLSQNNYRVVKPNAIGKSYGFSIMGLIPIVPPTYAQAMSDLSAHGGMTEGKAQALVNVSQERSTVFLILFSIPCLTVRADVVEFLY